MSLEAALDRLAEATLSDKPDALSLGAPNVARSLRRLGGASEGEEDGGEGPRSKTTTTTVLCQGEPDVKLRQKRGGE